MKDIKEYLERQLILSNELNTILKELNTLEEKKKECNYEETEKLKQNLDNPNRNNIDSIDDRISSMKRKLDIILSNPEIKKNSSVFYPAYNLYKRLNSLSSELNSIEKNVDKCYKNYNRLTGSSYDNIKSSNINNTLARTENISISPEVKKTDFSEDKNDDNLNENVSEPQNNRKAAGHNDLKADFTTEIHIPQEKISNQENISNNEYFHNNSITKASRHEDNHDKKFEFKIGTNILNIIGAVLILISLITFGKYVYTNYMSNLFKGIFLFAISIAILLSSEFIFKKKLPKFASGICALGIGCLYSSIIINYLVLYLINSTIALVLTVAVAGVSMHISCRDNSNIVRIIGLVGAYMCLMPMHFLYGITSYITITILIIINIANMFFPIKNRIFLIYSSIINVVFCEVLIISRFLEKPALFTFLTASLIINNLMYMKFIREKDDSRYYTACLLSSLLLILFNLYNSTIPFRLICLLISAVSYFITINKLKIVNFINFQFTMIFLMIIYRNDLDMLFSVLYIALMVTTMVYFMKNHDNKYLQTYFIGLVSFGLMIFAFSDMPDLLLYGIAFPAMIWFLSDKYKNNGALVTLKNAYLTAIAFIIIFMQRPFAIEIDVLLSCVLCIIYILVTNFVPKLKHDHIENSNLALIISGLFLCTVIGLDDPVICLISLVIGSVFIIMLTSERFISNKTLLDHKIIVYSIYSTYGVCALFATYGFRETWSNIILSIFLMIIAFINVWAGFKFKAIEVRRYGLILSLIVCAKLLIIDFYSFEFLMKSVLFLVVGVIALSISYVYSKLEHELKDKDEDKEK